MAEDRSRPPTRGRVAALWRSLWSPLARLAGRIGKRRDVDDILQEAFTRSWEIGGPSALRSYRAFLMRTAAQPAANQGRGSARFIAPVEGLPLADVYRQLTAESPEAHQEANQRFMSFCRAVGGLPEHARRAFVLKKVYGLTQQEIAERLDMTPAEVERHIANGLLRCRDYLEMIGAPVGGTDGGTDPRKSAPSPRR
ncbi:MAG TPA: sigma-70 family RNA polymerase sigma factor [Steroidobacteraceae bacterium]|jgi:RNA polymerase sigma-70 factor (ECF subfamily)|nr:sigma-70 family RNA polymerase sigma factor [Steroidobacteraceae bacterium]